LLFLVISTPRPEPPNKLADRRHKFWRWLAPLQESGECEWGYARVGRGAVAVFDVGSNERLHRLLNEWSDIIPVTFEVLPLIKIEKSKAFLDSVIADTEDRE
jgi:hypothetical protein